jgi:HEAT repeat protein
LNRRAALPTYNRGCVAIKPSSAKEVAALVADLSGGSAVKRDGAVARLIVIGPRAVARLIALVESPAPSASRAAALRALEGIRDARALDPAIQLLRDPDAAVAAAAASLARVFLRGERGAEIVDRLTAAALDGSVAEPVRLAAIRALRDLDSATIAPLVDSLSQDRSSAVRAEAAAAKSPRKKPAKDPIAEITRAADAGLPDDVETLKKLVADSGCDAPLAVLLRIVERVRDREATEPPPRRAAWTTARAMAHLALARRGSRLAVYDLRESLEKAGDPLPVDALAALSLVGDASCLEPIASAHARTRDTWWRNHLLDLFRTIAKREKLTPRHAVIKRIAAKWPMLSAGAPRQ